MIFYEVICFCCKNVFRVYEGTRKYNQFKKNQEGKYCCDECSHKIQLEAIKHLFR
ncbi:DUF2197 domain-containing protein [Bacillus cereus group sp. N21]|uniref:DUF2197 domain-containing protein n=1 Tax=Bacillus cereus group sp. N21 TaxID=2794591 RepID=UPI0018F746CD|nr:DUF2197 domain-containing protein [Bacillus cereus group sp. N21]MBJ8030489.1 DUF2197 domain-containing protein [Bacillus cereus group sp. N21]